MNNKIKKSASLIISSILENSKVIINNSTYNYKVMLLKRNNKMRVAPSHHVYPGGKYDKLIDESLNWLQVLFNSKQLEQIEKNPSVLRKKYLNGLINQNSIGNLIKSDKSNEENNLKIPFEVSFRLCAIRETFEETGLLLAFDKNDMSQEIYSKTELFRPKTITNYYKNNLNEIKKWHLIIKNDSSKFLKMFQDLNLVPDLFGLHEWANWITPIHEKHRFDTYFFTCFLNEIPPEMFLDISKDEIETLEFYTPAEALNKYNSNKIKFIPPQLYEFNRLRRFKEFKQLSEYSLNRQNYGLKPWLPKFVQDGKIGLLPGDYMYNLIDEISDTISIPKDSNCVDSNLKLNRIIKRLDNKRNELKYEIICNYDFDGINSS